MSSYTVVRDYPYPIETVWRVLTEPRYVAEWTTSGRGGRPEGFAPVVGTEFRFVGRPRPGWAGVVHCTLTAVDPPHSLSYTWRSEQDSVEVTSVSYRLEAIPGGTRYTWEHTGFSGPGGFVMSLLLARVRRRMLTDGVPPVLAAVRGSG